MQLSVFWQEQNILYLDKLAIEWVQACFQYSYSHKGTKSALSDNCALRETKRLLYFIESLKYRQYLDVGPQYLCFFKSTQFYIYKHAYGIKTIIFGVVLLLSI